jgi:hypothetical protein
VWLPGLQALHHLAHEGVKLSTCRRDQSIVSAGNGFV